MAMGFAVNRSGPTDQLANDPYLEWTFPGWGCFV